MSVRAAPFSVRGVIQRSPRLAQKDCRERICGTAYPLAASTNPAACPIVIVTNDSVSEFAAACYTGSTDRSRDQATHARLLGGTGHRPEINYRAAIRIDTDGGAGLQGLLGVAMVSPAWRAALEEAIEGPAYEESFLGLWTNGVEFAVGRQVFDAGGNGIELQCDACDVSFEPDDSWMDAVGAWFGGDDLVSFPCPSCGQQALLTEWRGPWPWGFGNLGIEFWNWPSLSDDFIHAITRKLGRSIGWPNR